ncbi:MAG: SRPBCC domain-containing protein [Saprospiraceae bacterium]|nr:SRPBCC domain-containing protein [Saprospiraceae bacterium]MBK9221059.1 SRPBCC domain-containing protein [Saprospiraceae bacterium]
MQAFITNQIIIKASLSKVWSALTDPDQTQKYMFGCKTVSNWNIGDSLLWIGQQEGNDIIFVKGFILEIQPNRLLKYTVFDPNNPLIPDLPENYLNVTYELIEKDDHTQLTVTQGDYTKVEDGERRYQESYNKGEAWNPILIKIKKLVESEITT